MWWAYTLGGAYIGGGGLIVGGLRYTKYAKLRFARLVIFSEFYNIS
jgi:hypothetical protein